MPGRPERNFIRGLVGSALCISLSAGFAAPVPAELPAIAVRQPGLYRLEMALLIFYGCLLLLTPAFSGLIRGRLPVEISTRGAKFAAEASQSEATTEQRIGEMGRTIEAHTEELTSLNLEVRRLNEEDSKQPKVS
jgi:hypothetical protein